MPGFTIEQPICAIDFAIDGIVLAWQPFGIDYAMSDPIIEQTVRGFRIGALQRGREATVTWGEDHCPGAAVAEVRAALGTTLEHTLTWTEPSGVAVSIDVIAPGVETEFSQDSPGFYDPLRLRFVERAPARAGVDEGTCLITFLDIDSVTLGTSTTSGGPTFSRDSAYVFAADATGAPNSASWSWDGASLGAPNVQSVNVSNTQVAAHPTQDVIAITAPNGAFLESIFVYSFVGGVIGGLIATSATYAVGLGGAARGLAWSPDGTYIAVLASASLYLNVFSWDGATLGAKISAGTSTVGGSGRNHRPTFAPDNSAVAYGDAGTGHLAVFGFDGATLSGPTRPAVTPTGTNGQDAWFHPSGNFIAVGNSAGSAAYVYPWDGATLGTRIDLDVPLIGASTFSLLWSNGGTYLWILDGGSRLYAYAFDDVALTLTQECLFTLTTTMKSMALSPDNMSIAVFMTNGDLRMFGTGLTTV